MATTTNYGWTTPDDTALVKDGASAIRTLGSSVDTTTKNLNPETTLGDIAYRSSTANVKTRLAIGSTGQVLTVAGGVPSWATASSGGETLLSTTTLTGSSVTISSIDQTYKHLQIVIITAYNSTDALCNMRINGITSGTYKWQQVAAILGTGAGQYGTNADTEMEIGRLGNSNAYNVAMHAEIYIPRYAEAEFTKIYFNSLSYESSYYWHLNGSGVQSTAQALSSITLFPSTGTFSGGTVYIYGVK